MSSYANDDPILTLQNIIVLLAEEENKIVRLKYADIGLDALKDLKVEKKQHDTTRLKHS